MNRVMAFAVLSLLGVATNVEAAVVTRSFKVTADRFTNFNGQPAPFRTFSADISVTYDTDRSGFYGAPDFLRIVTDGMVNTAAFSAAPIAGYFVPDAMTRTGRIGVGGAINGGNVSLPGTNDFYIVFDADTVRFGSVSFVTPQLGTFLSAGAAVRETTTAAIVPEPATWMMLLTGFGLIGMAQRRSRRCAILA